MKSAERQKDSSLGRGAAWAAAVVGTVASLGCDPTEGQSLPTGVPIVSLARIESNPNAFKGKTVRAWAYFEKIRIGEGNSVCSLPHGHGGPCDRLTWSLYRIDLYKDPLRHEFIGTFPLSNNQNRYGWGDRVGPRDEIVLFAVTVEPTDLGTKTIWDTSILEGRDAEPGIAGGSGSTK